MIWEINWSIRKLNKNKKIHLTLDNFKVYWNWGFTQANWIILTKQKLKDELFYNTSIIPLLLNSNQSNMFIL
jgi:hypothetical protein